MKRSMRVLCSLVCAAVLLITVSAAFAANLEYPIVETPNGSLRGVIDRGVYTFRGIQYATSERFGLPSPIGRWEGVKDALSYGPIAPIARMTGVGIDEFFWPHRYWPQNDVCQYLNVWSPKLDPAAKRPVMVYLHGGTYTNGSAIEALAQDGGNLSSFGDVVVVTVNHRLNVLGLLDLSAYGDEYKDSARATWADLVMSLEWVRDNITAFGGDPDNVTIFGQSGGGGKVLSLMHIPSAEGLFKRAVSHSSGTAVNFGKTTKEMTQKLAARILDILGLDASRVGELKTINYDILIGAGNEAIAQLREEDPANAAYYGWFPAPGDDYMSLDFCEWAKDMPFMNGSVFSERVSVFNRGDGRKNEWTPEEIDANLKSVYGENIEPIKAEFAKLFPDKKIQDVYFYSTSGRTNILHTTDLRLNAGGPLYQYMFSFEAPALGGVTPFHCADLIYVFHNVDLLQESTGGTPECYAMQDVMARAWVNFATNGNPSQPGLEWKPYTNEEMLTMVFDVKSELRRYDDSALRSLMPVQ